MVKRRLALETAMGDLGAYFSLTGVEWLDEAGVVEDPSNLMLFGPGFVDSDVRVGRSTVPC